MLSAMNLPYLDTKFMKWLFGGIYTDFVSDLFEDVGSFLVEVYKAQCLFPIVEFSLRATIRLVKR
jgi:hypothetical protein